MKIQLRLNYKNIPYQFTIDENEVDIDHYEEQWVYYFGAEENEIRTSNHEDDGLVFEVNANKKFPEGCDNGVISGAGLFINVYADEDGDAEAILLSGRDVEVLYL